MTDAVLVVRRGGLGDTLLLLPVLAALRAAHPRAALHFAGVLEFAAVLAEYGAVDRARSSEDLQLWALAGDSAVGVAARARLGCYAHIVGDEPLLAALAAPGLRVQVFDPRPARSDLPLALQIGAQLGLSCAGDDAVLRPRPPTPPHGPVALAPGSGSLCKCWPRAHWLGLAARLAAAGTPLAVVSGPAERERDDPARWPWPATTAIWSGLSVVELAQRLCQARAFVGNDSGVTHLAAALAVAPTVAIFGPSEPLVWAPRGPHVRVVGRRTAGPPSAGVDAVLAALGLRGS